MVSLAIPTTAPALTGAPQGRWTLAEWETLPADDNRYEIIDGMLYMSTAPSSFHQWIITRLYRQIGIPAEDGGLAYVLPSPIGVIMPGCDPVQPDLVIVRAERREIIRDKRIYGVPDLLIEVLSPGSTPYDEEVKLDAYANAGVPEYAVVDPVARSLRLYVLEAQGKYSAPREFTSTELVRFAGLPSIEVQVGKLFDGAPDTTL